MTHAKSIHRKEKLPEDDARLTFVTSGLPTSLAWQPNSSLMQLPELALNPHASAHR
jgi:hypothetical protein